MLKVFAAALLVSLLFVPSAFAQLSQVDVQFVINGDSVHQSTRFLFASPVNGTLNYTMPGSARDISVSDGNSQLDYSLTRSGESYFLNIFASRPVSQLVIDYSSDNVIFHLDSINHFFTEFAFDNLVNVTASLKLPVGYTLYDNSFKPESGQTLSDGRSIILYWQETSVESIFFSVKYVEPRQEFGLWIAVIAILAASLLFIFFYFRNRHKEDLLFGFRHDEKIAINYIQEKRVALQRDLEENFKFSRAKATRIVSKLVEKGLVKKQRYGRTNKLTWNK
ncbi:MAG: hypothetical protein HY517_00660 [Candidatus Aenigmarchaeota archaeon]|nr:hypothetical protein [Candidatus Aenigmarchaeota archaeon]